jgi:DNA-binding CsgD family transcriptional regulator
MLFILDPDARLRARTQLLVAQFGLTRRESELTQTLVAGQSLSAAAQSLGISSATARTYLKAVFAKTGAQSQADLVRLALSVAAIG